MPEPSATLNDRSAPRDGVGSWRSLAAVLAIVGVIAVWINLDGLHRHQTGDSVVPVLMSLYRWTPFYWETNRLGSLLPLLARPFRDPLANMLVQYTTAAWLGISAFFLGARYVLGRGPWIAAGAITAGIYLGIQRPELRFEMMMTQHAYGTALALGFGGLILLDHVATTRAWMWGALGMAALSLAFWVNVSLIASLLPVIVLRHWPSAAKLRESPDVAAPGGPPAQRDPTPGFCGKRGRFAITLRASWLSLAGVAVGFIFSLVWSRMRRHYETYTLLPLLQIGQSWMHLWREAFATFPGAMWAAAAALPAVTIVFVVSRQARQSIVDGLRAALPLLAGALCHSVVMGSLVWVGMNAYAARYLIVSLMLTLLAVAALASYLVFQIIGKRWRSIANWATMAGFVGTIVVLHGIPSLASVRADIDRTTGRLTKEIMEAKCTHVIGSYWVVWPAVFHANLELFERGDARIVWGISYRCGPTKKFWSKVPPEQTKIAAAIGDDEVEKIAEMYQVGPLVEERQLQTIRVLRPAGFGTGVR